MRAFTIDGTAMVSLNRYGDISVNGNRLQQMIREAAGPVGKEEAYQEVPVRIHIEFEPLQLGLVVSTAGGPEVEEAPEVAAGKHQEVA